MRQDWNLLLNTKDFWTCYLSSLELFPSDATRRRGRDLITVAFDLPRQYRLRVRLKMFSARFDGPVHRLELLHPTLPTPMILGRLGDPHQMSDAFRWEEFEAINRYLDERGAEYGPPWSHRLLLAPYIAFFEGAVDNHSELLRGCLADSKLFTPEEVDLAVSTFGPMLEEIRTYDEYHWTFDQELGWIAEGKRSVPYSMRHRRNDDLDFSAIRNLFRALVHDA